MGNHQPTIEELPGDLSHVAKIIEEVAPGKGVEATLAIAENFRSTNIYCHNVDKFKRRDRDQLIIEKYNSGKKPPDLAKEFNLSIRHIWNILGKEPE